MRKAKLAGYLILLATAGLVSQQAAGPKPAPTATVRNAHSTEADLAVPLCPAKFGDGILTFKYGLAPFRDSGVTPPKVTSHVSAALSDEAMHQKRKGRITHFEAILSLVVNIDGEPEKVCLVQSAGYGLDAKAAEAVQQFRFAPATKDGRPVASRIQIQTEFSVN